MRRNVSLFYYLGAVLALLLTSASLTQGQGFARLIVANGNVFGPSNMATFGVYSLGAGPSYTEFDSVAASSVQDVYAPLSSNPVIEGKFFIAADSFLIKYDRQSLQREAIVKVKGIRKIAVWDSLVVVTRGFGASGDWVQAFGGSHLDSLFSIQGISGDCEGIAVKDDRAYVAVPGAFGSTTGQLAVVDLPTQSLAQVVDLDSLGEGVSRVYAAESGDAVYALSTNGFGSPTSTVNKYMIALDSVVHLSLPVSASGGSQHSSSVQGFYANFGGQVGFFSFAQDTLTRPGILPYTSVALTGVIEQTTQTEDIVFTQTDYFSYGRLYHYRNGSLYDSLDVGISPEAIAMLEEFTVSRPELQESRLQVWPSLTEGEVQVQLPHPQGILSVMDVQGQILEQKELSGQQGRVNVSAYPSGLYFLQFQYGDERFTAKVIRR